MTPIARCVVVVAGAVLVAGVAIAEDRGTGTEGLPSRSPSGQAGTSSPGATGAGSAAEALGGSCPHRIEGTVKKIDKSAGTVSIDVPGSDAVELHLPPGDLAGFEQGDQVVVSMGIRESHTGSVPTEPGLDPDRGLGTERGLGSAR